MKKSLLLLLILNVAVLNLFAKPSKKTLVEQGLYLASLMKEKASCIYVFTFEEAYPVAVTFECGEDNAVFATATFLLDRHFPKSLEDMFPEIGRRLSVKKISY